MDQETGFQDVQDSLTSAEVNEIEERRAYGRIVNAMLRYMNGAFTDIQQWERNYLALPTDHQRLLQHMPSKLEEARACAQRNQTFFNNLIDTYSDPSSDHLPPNLADARTKAKEQEKDSQCTSPMHIDKVRYVLKNLVRDWSVEGGPERAQSYGRIVEELKIRFADWPKQSPPPRVLVPGAGLGRLCCEIAALGYPTEGNEFSYYMLLTSNFFLNCVHTAGQFVVHPWLHSCSNHVRDEDQLRGISIPDVPATDLVKAPLLSMCAGDFVEAYSRDDAKEQFDCVVTCYFLDTAHNVLEYIQVVHHVLKPGGIWINLGPLQWHWEGSDSGGMSQQELSVEIPLDVVAQVAQSLGFIFIRDELVESSFLGNRRSLCTSSYKCAFWTLMKGESSTVVPNVSTTPSDKVDGFVNFGGQRRVA